MSPLKTGVAAAAAFILGWAAHEGIARAGDHEEPTAMSPAQAAQAVESARERKQREENEKPGSSLITPLNVRDPSALVMGPSPSYRSCSELAASAKAKKCDCAAERLKKTGRKQPERF